MDCIVMGLLVLQTLTVLQELVLVKLAMDVIMELQLDKDNTVMEILALQDKIVSQIHVIMVNVKLVRTLVQMVVQAILVLLILNV